MAEAVGGNAAEELKEYVSRISNLHDEADRAKEKHIKPIREAQAAIYAQAAGNGFDKKALKEVVRKSRFAKELREQVDIYEGAVLSDILE